MKEGSDEADVRPEARVLKEQKVNPGQICHKGGE